MSLVNEVETEATAGFSVSLGNFDGPFDLLLSLIAKHEMDITEVSLSIVTSEFIAYLKDIDSEEELDQASEFVVVAATLLDLKVAGLLPQGELVDAEDVALSKPATSCSRGCCNTARSRRPRSGSPAESRPRPRGTCARCASRRSTASRRRNSCGR